MMTKCKSAVRFATVAMLLVLVGCADDTPPTQVIVYVHAESGVLMDTVSLELRVDKYTGRSDMTRTTFDSAQVAVNTRINVTDSPKPLAFPYHLALAPTDDDGTREYVVTATARRIASTTPTPNADDDAALVARTRLRGTYRQGKKMRLDVWLRDSCAGVACDLLDQSCRPVALPALGTCQGIQYGELVEITDDGDAGTRDGSTDMPGTDAGIDLGPPDLGPTDLGPCDPDAAAPGIDCDVPDQPCGYGTLRCTAGGTLECVLRPGVKSLDTVCRPSLEIGRAHV